MATYQKFFPFVSDVLKGRHNFSSDSTCTVMVALTAAANPPVSANGVLSDLTEISYTNLSSRIVTGITANQVGGVATITATDLTLTASGTVSTFRYCALYNDDAASKNLIGFYDIGADITLNNGDTLLIDFTIGFATLT